MNTEWRLAAGGKPLDVVDGKVVNQMAKFQIYKDRTGEYRWRLLADNNEIIADSSEGYVNKSDCEHGVELLKRLAKDAQLEDRT